MKINELNRILTAKMQKLLKDRKHIETGKLSKSIKFNCTFDGVKLKISLDALEYIQYLDDGKFVSDFISSKDVQDTISQFVVEDIAEAIQTSFNSE